MDNIQNIINYITHYKFIIALIIYMSFYIPSVYILIKKTNIIKNNIVLNIISHFIKIISFIFILCYIFLFTFLKYLEKLDIYTGIMQSMFEICKLYELVGIGTLLTLGLVIVINLLKGKTKMLNKNKSLIISVSILCIIFICSQMIWKLIFSIIF